MNVRTIAMVVALGTAPTTQSQNAIPGDPVTISGKFGIGTLAPTKKLEVHTAFVWDGIQIVGSQPDGAGAYFGMRSTGGSNRGFHIYADSRSQVDSLVMQSDYATIQFWTLYGTPVNVLKLKHTGDAIVHGDVYSRGVKLGPPGAVLQGAPGANGINGTDGTNGTNGKDGKDAASLVFETKVLNYNTSADLQCNAGFRVIVASCQVNGPPVLNDSSTQLPPGDGIAWTNYLTPNANQATGVHCQLAPGLQSQAIVRCMQ